MHNIPSSWKVLLGGAALILLVIAALPPPQVVAVFFSVSGVKSFILILTSK